MRRFAVHALMALALGCGSSAPARVERASGPVTFTEHVAPIVFSKCAPCHRPGEAAPFSLLTYGDARQRARLIADVTARRVMPPWLPVEGHGTFMGERRLTSQEVDTLAAWHAQGAAEGDPSRLPPMPVFKDGWQLGVPDLVLTLPQPYQLPAEGGDIWRNFVIPVTLGETRYVRAVELQPGSARFVHHAVMGVDATRASARRDASDAEPGFEGMELGDAQPPDGHLVGWTPGLVATPGVEGSAWKVDPGDDLVLQLHLIPSGKVEQVQPRVGLYFAPAPPTGPPMFLLRLDADHLLDIPVGAARFEVTDRFELPVDVTVHAIYPHAHFLAKTIHATARRPDGREEPLIRIDDWNFKWQDVYRYRTALRLPKGTVLSFRYTYDNTAENPRNPSRPPLHVRAGMRSRDEMAHLQLQVQPDRAEDITTLRTAMYVEMVRKAPRDAWVHYELANLRKESGDRAGAQREYEAAVALDPAHAAALTNLAVLWHEDGQLERAMPLYRAALKAEPDFVPALFNLGNLLRERGEANEAARHYERAIRLEPSMASAHNNLGELLASQGRVAEALRLFEEAVRLNPMSATAHANVGAALGATGRVSEAIPHFRRALELDPANEAARRNLEVIESPQPGRR